MCHVEECAHSGMAGNLAAAAAGVERLLCESGILFRWIFAVPASQSAHKGVVD
jgi:hypothetical protein